jgi:hypothetical protein
MAGDDRLFRVHVCYSLPECDAVQSMLAAYGIPAYIRGRNFAGVSPHFLVALNGLRVEVPFVARDEAFRLINEVNKPRRLPESAAFRRHGILYALFFVTMYLFMGFQYLPIWLHWREGVYDEIEGPPHSAL